DIGVSATLTPFGFQPWRFDTELHLVSGDEWRVVGSPSILHPDLAERDTLIEVLAAPPGISSDTDRSELSKPGVQPDWFVPVGTIAASETNAVDTLQATPGVLLREGAGWADPSADL